MSDLLSEFQENLILSLFPHGARITQANYFQSDYLPSPMQVLVSLPNGEQRNVVLRMSRKPFGIERETRLLPILSRFGLQVPNLLSEITSDLNDINAGSMTVLSFLSGENLQTWSCKSSADLEMAIGMLFEAVARLHQLTEPLSQANTTDWLPRKTLAAELQDLIQPTSLWIKTAVFSEAVEKLMPALNSIQTPLVFSNGDYQPGNFLSDGKELTGFVDFENACFEDPHVGFAKYRIYDLHPLNKAGVVERYLQINNLSETDFAPRLAVRCLWTLQNEIPISERHRDYGQHVLRLLENSLKLMN
jgi:aminoglycoside phosphotransferase